MYTVQRHESGFVQSSPHRESVGFAAIAAVCVVIATAEVLYGVAAPWPAGIAWMQGTPVATALAATSMPMVASK
jgi:hypothetical protein